MAFIVRVGKLLVRDLGLGGAAPVDNCNLGYLWFDEDCNSALVVAAGF